MSPLVTGVELFRRVTLEREARSWDTAIDWMLTGHGNFSR
jgi:hypothetical protein